MPHYAELPLLTKCSTCPDEMLQEEIEFVLETKPYCKSCVEADKELSDKSHHATRILITGALYGLSMDQQKDLHKQLSLLYPNFDRLYSDLLYHEQTVQIIDDVTKEVIHTVPSS